MALLTSAFSMPLISILALPYNSYGGTEEQWKEFYNLSMVHRQLYEETQLLPFALNVF